MPKWQSKVFEDTSRDWWVYVPAQCSENSPACVLVFQDGDNDLDNANGNWPLANQQMARALAFAGYGYRFVFGEGFHSNKHGRAILPDSLRWLWRGWESEQPK
jgi:hypothetical protein